MRAGLIAVGVAVLIVGAVLGGVFGWRAIHPAGHATPEQVQAAYDMLR